MADASIPVDLLNPGQVFACMGFLEAADILCGDAEGGFDWSDAADVRFHLRAAGDENPFTEVLRFLAGAEIVAEAPQDSGLSAQKWNIKTAPFVPSDTFPFSEPQSPATLPALITGACGNQIRVDYWGDSTQRDNVKFWAGAGGYPGVALFRDGLDLIRDRIDASASDPFSVSAPQSSSFRLDWRRDYVPLEVGFSPNSHGAMVMLGYPLVELLAAIGLTHARPMRHTKLDYTYQVPGKAPAFILCPTLMRAVLGGAPIAFERRCFRMTLAWPGQENQARCILNTIEEPIK